MSMYIAEGLRRSDNVDFNTFYFQLHDQLNLHADEIYNQVLENQTILKSDPFVFQMVLNMTATLDLPSNKKAQLFGLAIQQKFELQANGEISAMAANLAIALILRKGNGLTTDLVRPFIQQGIIANQGNPKALNEFLVRVRTYYPDYEIK